jgi:hypothetical protein
VVRRRPEVSGQDLPKPGEVADMRRGQPGDLVSVDGAELGLAGTSANQVQEGRLGGLRMPVCGESVEHGEEPGVAGPSARWIAGRGPVLQVGEQVVDGVERELGGLEDRSEHASPGLEIVATPREDRLEVAAGGHHRGLDLCRQDLLENQFSIALRMPGQRQIGRRRLLLLDDGVQGIRSQRLRPDVKRGGDFGESPGLQDRVEALPECRFAMVGLVRSVRGERQTTIQKA